MRKLFLILGCFLVVSVGALLLNPFKRSFEFQRRPVEQSLSSAAQPSGSDIVKDAKPPSVSAAVQTESEYLGMARKSQTFSILPEGDQNWVLQQTELAIRTGQIEKSGAAQFIDELSGVRRFAVFERTEVYRPHGSQSEVN